MTQPTTILARSSITCILFALLIAIIVHPAAAAPQKSTAKAKTTTRKGGTKSSAASSASSKKTPSKAKQGDDDGRSASDSDSGSSSNDKEEPDSSSSKDDASESTDSKKKPESTPEILTPEKVPQRLSSILGAAPQRARWGVHVEVADTGQPLFSLNAEEGFIPASNRKNFTAALALDQLGPNYVFRTFLYKTGTTDARGTLNGNLVIVPTGDPTFNTRMFKAGSSDWVYRDWAAKVKEAGVKQVTGDLLIDCSQWDMDDLTPRGWPERVMNDSYAPETSPLTINENLTNIILTPGSSGGQANVSFAPPATGYPVLNKTSSGKQGGPVARRVGSSHIEVRGNVSEKKTIWSIPIDRPTLYAAANFRHHLMQAGIPINGSVRIITAAKSLPGPSAQNTIAMVQSPPLIEIINTMMKTSNNHMAEQIYVAVSNAKLGKGSYTNSLRLEQDLLRRAGIDPAGLHAMDGSGLSESNRVRPADMTKLLTFMSKHVYAQQYYDCMAISGKEGTLRNRMSTIAGRVHAKTGTINNVKTLSGYIALNQGKILSFSFLVNRTGGSSPSGLQDSLCRALARLEL